MSLDSLSGKLGIDVTDFKTGVRAANKEMQLLESRFKASTAVLGDWSKSAQGLEERIGTLTSKIDIQKEKVSLLRDEYEKIKAEYGENSRATKEAEIALNKQVETLGKMESELSESEQALQDLSNAEQEAGDNADEASGKFDGLSSVIGGIGGVVKGAIAVVSGLALAVAAVGTAIGGLVFSTASASGELVDLSTKTGISTTRLQEFDYIAKQVGTTQETITSSFAKLTKSMSAAQGQYADYNAKQDEAIAKGEEFDGQLGDTAAAFEELGVSVTDATGQLRDREDVFNDVIKALGNIDNEAQRDALAMAIFGRSAMELNPLIKAGTDELQKLAEKAHEVGAVMSEEDVAAMEAFDDTLSSLQSSLKGTLGTLATAFLPGFQMVFDQLGGYLAEFSDIVRSADGDFGKIAEGVSGLIGKIINDIATQAPQMLEAGLGILQSIIDSILANLPVLISAAIGIITSLLDFIVLNLPTLIDAALQIIIALAQGITQALPTLIPAIAQVLTTIIQTIVENLPLLIQVALDLIVALVQGIILALPMLESVVGPELSLKLIGVILSMIPAVLVAGAKILIALAEGLISMINPKVVEFGSKFLEEMLFQSIMWQVRAIEMGKNFITGIIEGVKNASGALYNAVQSIASQMVSTIKNVFLMRSPSRVGKDIGSNLIGSVGLGGDEAAPEVRRKLARQMVGLTQDLTQATNPSAGTGGGGVGSGIGSSSVSIGDIIVNLAGTNLTAPQVASATKNGVLEALRAKGAM